MAYASINFKTKKAFKDAVAQGKVVHIYQPAGIGDSYSNYTGDVAVEGPYAPQPHTWYGTATLVNGIVKGVK